VIIIRINIRHFVLYFQGHFVRALGEIGDKDTENEVLLLEHDVPHSKFSEAVLSCLPKLPWVITENVSGIFFFLSNFRP
jgi:exoribonuclease R